LRPPQLISLSSAGTIARLALKLPVSLVQMEAVDSTTTTSKRKRRMRFNFTHFNAVLLLLLANGMLSSCCSLFPCDLQPPLTGTDHETQIKANAAADAISTAIAKGSIGVDISKTVKDTYTAVGKDDVAFIILIKAADCESRRGHVQAAADLRRLAGIELANRHHVTPEPPPAPNELAKTEEKILRRSPIKSEIEASVNSLELK
jgi:hypothetical protein